MMAADSLSNSRPRLGMPLLSALLKKNRTPVLDREPATEWRLPVLVRGGLDSDTVFGSSGASAAEVCSPFTSFLPKLTLLPKIAVPFADHLLFGKFGDKQAARIRFRPAVLNQTHVVPADNSIR